MKPYRPSRGRFTTKTSVVLIVALTLFPAAWAEWKPHVVRQLAGKAGILERPGKFQIVTATWNRVAAVPYIVYMPEKDRLLMLVSCDYPHQAMVLTSSDHGKIWTTPRPVHTDPAGKPDTGMGTSLTYLGSGKLLLAAGEGSMWFSSDYGETWGNRTPMPKTGTGLTFNLWDPFMVDRQRADRVLAGGYAMDMTLYQGAATAGYSYGGIRVSQDRGHTWGDLIKPSEWTGVNEIALIRAGNGNLVAACRTDWPKRFRKQNFDHYEGIAVSISKNNGGTWSKLNRLYAWGRHHPSLVLLQNGDLVMSYVVRKGYPDTAQGYPQFGIEAIVSRDHGETWDLDHRYILAAWPGIATGPNAWYASSQATSTVLLPGGSLLTAFGTGYRSKDPAGTGKPGPRDVGLVAWKNHHPVNNDQDISKAPYDSDLRNNFDPLTSKNKGAPACAAAYGKTNIAVLVDGAQASASANDGVPAYLLRNLYSRPALTLETMPAWAEVRWPSAHRIEEIHIQPGAPEHARRPVTECVPLDYRLQYSKDGQWVDLVPPATGARRFKDFDPRLRAYLIQDSEFEYVHRFPAVSTQAVRMFITRSSGAGETVLRAIEVFEATR